MNRIAFALLLALLPAVAQADIVFYYTTGASLYVRFDDASNTAVNLTEGSSLKAGRYTVADAAIDSAGLAAGTYTGRILIGTAGAQSGSDVEVGVLPEFIFGASTQTTSYQQNRNTIMEATLSSFTTNGTLGQAVNWLKAAFTSSGVYSIPALANGPSGEGGTISREAADMIAARVNAHRGDFYPNSKQVWVLKRDTSGLEVKNDFQISKGAGETLKVYIDFASVVGRNEFIETVNSLSLSGGTAEIVADSQEIVSNLLSFDVSGGAAEDVTAVNFDVTTTEDQVIAGDVCEFNVVE